MIAETLGSGASEWAKGAIQDVRFGCRTLRKSPVFTVVVALALALGIGANTAVFSMVEALAFRHLPVDTPQEIVSLERVSKSGTSSEFSFPELEEIRSRTNSVFREVMGVQLFHVDGISIDGRSEPIATAFVTTNFFQVLGIRPFLGAYFEPRESRIDAADPVLVVSYSFWKSHLGADPGVVGKSVLVNGRPVTIAGVAPKGFYGIISIVDVQGYLPIGMAAQTSDSKSDFLTNRKIRNTIIVGRLKRNMSLVQARPVLNTVGRQLSEGDPESDKQNSLRADLVGPLGPGSSSAQSNISTMATFFLVLVGLLLLLACVNVTTLLLIRITSRRREMALRSALGAGPSRLVRQLLIESSLLALLGCAGGILIGLGASRAVGSLKFSTVAVPFILDFGFNWRIFAYSLTLALLCGFLVTIAPAIRAARQNANEFLQGHSQRVTGGRQFTRNALVVAEISGSIALLIVAGLFVRSLNAAQRVDLGFDPTHVVTVGLTPAQAGYTESQARQFLQELLSRMQSAPDIEAASLAATVPMGYYALGAEGLKIEGYTPPANQKPPSAGYNAVSSEYFETLRIPILRGRAIRDSDNQASQYIAVINEEMARRYWPDHEAIGRHFTLPSDTGRSIEVVGIAKNSRTGSISGGIGPQFYRPLAQDYQASVVLQLRTRVPLGTAIHETTASIHSLAPTIPVFDVHSMLESMDTLNGLLLYRLGAVLTASLGLLGLVLAVVGVYGVVSYAVSQRTVEIGIRMAIGAQPRQILLTILGQGLVVTVVGILIGVLAAAAIGNLTRSLLLGVSPLDPVAYFSAAGGLGFVVLVACYIPARRAMRVDPMVVLRYN